MDDIDLLDQGYAWTAARIAPISAGGLDSLTPCVDWSLRELVEHTVVTATAFADAVDPAGTTTGTTTDWDQAVAELAARSGRGWRAAGVMDQVFELPFGTMPAPIALSANLLEVVVHGWDISQATGESLDIPSSLAIPILEFARHAISDDGRGASFGARLDLGDTPSEQLISYLGRKPL
jgi:uncharacterized protein (TIGR03086 family)